MLVVRRGPPVVREIRRAVTLLDVTAAIGPELELARSDAHRLQDVGEPLRVEDAEVSRVSRDVCRARLNLGRSLPNFSVVAIEARIEVTARAAKGHDRDRVGVVCRHAALLRPGHEGVVEHGSTVDVGERVELRGEIEKYLLEDALVRLSEPPLLLR